MDMKINCTYMKFNCYQLEYKLCLQKLKKVKISTIIVIERIEGTACDAHVLDTLLPWSFVPTHSMGYVSSTLSMRELSAKK